MAPPGAGLDLSQSQWDRQRGTRGWIKQRKIKMQEDAKTGERKKQGGVCVMGLLKEIENETMGSERGGIYRKK